MSPWATLNRRLLICSSHLGIRTGMTSASSAEMTHTFQLRLTFAMPRNILLDSNQIGRNILPQQLTDDQAHLYPVKCLTLLSVPHYWASAIFTLGLRPPPPSCARSLWFDQDLLLPQLPTERPSQPIKANDARKRLLSSHAPPPV